MKFKFTSCLMLALLSTSASALEHQAFNQALDKLDISIPAEMKAYQADAIKGQKIANTRCIACHGEAMLKVMQTYPALEGQKGAYLVKQLLSFKTGQRANPIMQAQAMTLSNTEIKDLALWFSSQPMRNLSK